MPRRIVAAPVRDPILGCSFNAHWGHHESIRHRRGRVYRRFRRRGAGARRPSGHRPGTRCRATARAGEDRRRGRASARWTTAPLLTAQARAADAVINAASSDHRGAVEALIEALAGSGKVFLHTSGSSIVGDASGGEGTDRIYLEDQLPEPTADKAKRVAIDQLVLASAARGVRSAVLCNTLIYGHGALPRDSVQLPRLLKQARKSGVVRHVGRGLEHLVQRAHRRRRRPVSAGAGKDAGRHVLLCRVGRSGVSRHERRDRQGAGHGCAAGLAAASRRSGNGATRWRRTASDRTAGCAARARGRCSAGSRIGPACWTGSPPTCCSPAVIVGHG